MTPWDHLKTFPSPSFAILSLSPSRLLRSSTLMHSGMFPRYSRFQHEDFHACCHGFTLLCARHVRAIKRTGMEHDAFCDGCAAKTTSGGTPVGPCARVHGTRYKCSVCPDFDLCEICLLVNEKEGFVHNPTHLFLRIASRAPIQTGPVALGGWPAPPRVPAAESQPQPPKQPLMQQQQQMQRPVGQFGDTLVSKLALGTAPDANIQTTWGKISGILSTQQPVPAALWPAPTQSQQPFSFMNGSLYGTPPALGALPAFGAPITSSKLMSFGSPQTFGAQCAPVGLPVFGATSRGPPRLFGQG